MPVAGSSSLHPDTNHTPQHMTRDKHLLACRGCWHVMAMQHEAPCNNILLLYGKETIEEVEDRDKAGLCGRLRSEFLVRA